ncbi:MAG: DUF58 domain-containing protein [Cyanobacteria bacterium REEB65]|nr:DUF58 domain-containing protein [Cyanobacteria bacterium REEB65]
MARRVAVLGFLAFATLLAATNVQEAWLYALGSVFVAMLALSLGRAISTVRGMTATVRAEALASQGEGIGVAIRLENTAILPRTYIAVVAPPIGEAPVGLRAQKIPAEATIAIVEKLPGGAAKTVRLEVPTPRRGVFASPPVFLRSSPLGLWVWQRKVPAIGTVVVVPKVVPIGDLPWYRRQSAQSHGESALRSLAQGELIRSTREYRSGDPLRLVHWKRTARKGSLVVKETEGTQLSGGATIALDLAGHSQASLEQAILAAAALLGYLHQQGIAVRLVSQQGVTEGALTDQLIALAHADRTEEDLTRLLGEGGPAGVIAISAVDRHWPRWARHWIQSAAAGAVPLPGAIFCPEDAELGAVLREGRRG